MYISLFVPRGCELKFCDLLNFLEKDICVIKILLIGFPLVFFTSCATLVPSKNNECVFAWILYKVNKYKVN